MCPVLTQNYGSARGEAIAVAKNLPSPPSPPAHCRSIRDLQISRVLQPPHPTHLSRKFTSPRSHDLQPSLRLCRSRPSCEKLFLGLYGISRPCSGSSVHEHLALHSLEEKHLVHVFALPYIFSSARPTLTRSRKLARIGTGNVR